MNAIRKFYETMIDEQGFTELLLGWQAVPIADESGVRVLAATEEAPGCRVGLIIEFPAVDSLPDIDDHTLPCLHIRTATIPSLPGRDAIIIELADSRRFEHFTELADRIVDGLVDAPGEILPSLYHCLWGQAAFLKNPSPHPPCATVLDTTAKLAVFPGLVARFGADVVLRGAESTFKDGGVFLLPTGPLVVAGFERDHSAARVPVRPGILGSSVGEVAHLALQELVRNDTDGFRINRDNVETYRDWARACLRDIGHQDQFDRCFQPAMYKGALDLRTESFTPGDLNIYRIPVGSTLPWATSGIGVRAVEVDPTSPDLQPLVVESVEWVGRCPRYPASRAVQVPPRPGMLF